MTLRKNPGASDLVTLAILGLGAAAVLKSSQSGTTSGGLTPGISDATDSQISDLIAAGKAKPGDVVKIVVEDTPSGQQIQYATINYDPGNPQANQVVMSDDDKARRAGFYIPYVDETYMRNAAAKWSGKGADGWRDWLAEMASFADVDAWDYSTGGTGSAVVKLTAQDWDYFHHKMFGGDAPLTAELAGPAWSTKIGAEEYKTLISSLPGGAVVGREVHYYGPGGAKLRGLGALMNRKRRVIRSDWFVL